VAKDVLGKDSVKLIAGAAIQWVKISPNNKLIATGTYEGEVSVWDYPAGLKQWSVQGFRDVYRAVFLHDGKTLAIRGKNEASRLTVEYWHADTGKSKQHPLDPAVTALDFSPDGKLCIDSYKKGLFILWNVTEKEPMALLKMREPQSSGHLTFSNDGRYIASAGQGSQGQVHVWIVPKNK
jgi:WD40 repeat protein